MSTWVLCSDYEDMSCEMVFGQQPPPLSEDPALQQQPCYANMCKGPLLAVHYSTAQHSTLTVKYSIAPYSSPARWCARGLLPVSTMIEATVDARLR